MKLGLFISPTDWPLLKQHKLALTKSDAQDDPFLNATHNLTTNLDTGMSDDAYQRLLEEQYAALPEHIKGFMNFEYFCQQAEAKRDAIESSHQSQQDWPAIDRKRYANLGILRLFELNSTSLLHWSLVGRGHKSMLLMLNLNDVTVERWLGDQPHKWSKVKYSQGRPQKDTPLGFQHLFHQPSAYSWLKEWRLVLPWSLAREGLALPSGALESLSFGALFDSTLRQEIQHYRHFDHRLNALDFYQLLSKRERFELVTQPIEARLMASDNA